MATISNTPRPGYVWDSTDNVWYPIGVGAHGHTADSVGAIANALVDAKADLITATANDTPARLGVGANGTVLTADSAEATGLKWASPTSTGPNYTLINTGGTALTGAATITISGISGKNQLFVTIIGCSSASGNSNFYIRLNGDSGNYGYFNAIMIAPDSVTEDSLASASLMYIGAISANAGSVLSGYCWLDGCNSSGVKVMHHSTGSTNAGGGNAQLNTGGGTWSDSATVSSISIISSAGNFDAGTIYVYGA